MSDTGVRDADFIQSLERGLSVIRAFDGDHPKLSLSEVAVRTGLSRAAARRFLRTLVDLGYMRLEGSQFSLRPKILELGYAYLSSLSLPEVAMPHLEQLVEQVRESSSVSQLDGDDVVYIARVPTRRIMTVAISVGTRFPAYATSMGRVMLADKPADWLGHYLASTTLPPLTPHTKADPALLRAELARIRAQGWAAGRPGTGRGPALGGRADQGRRRPRHRRGQRLDARRAAQHGAGRRRPARAPAAHGPRDRSRSAAVGRATRRAPDIVRTCAAGRRGLPHLTRGNPGYRSPAGHAQADGAARHWHRDRNLPAAHRRTRHAAGLRGDPGDPRPAGHRGDPARRIGRSQAGQPAAAHRARAAGRHRHAGRHDPAAADGRRRLRGAGPGRGVTGRVHLRRPAACRPDRPRGVRP